MKTMRLTNEQVIAALSDACETNNARMVYAGAVAWVIFPDGPSELQRQAVAIHLKALADADRIKMKEGAAGRVFRCKKGAQ